MAVRAQFENSNEYVAPLLWEHCRDEGADVVLTVAHRVGVFSTLTNAYAIVAVGASENFYRCVRAPAAARIASKLVARADFRRCGGHILTFAQQCL